MIPHTNFERWVGLQALDDDRFGVFVTVRTADEDGVPIERPYRQVTITVSDTGDRLHLDKAEVAKLIAALAEGGALL